jgi:hypothetical protein
MEALNKEASLDMVFGHVIRFYDPPMETQQTGNGKPMPGPVAGTMLIRRESFFRVGPLVSAWRAGEPVDCVRASHGSRG